MENMVSEKEDEHSDLKSYDKYPFYFILATIFSRNRITYASISDQ
jgi:hypothetical protein